MDVFKSVPLLSFDESDLRKILSTLHLDVAKTGEI